MSDEPNLVDCPNLHARFVAVIARADKAEREAARLRGENDRLRADLQGIASPEAIGELVEALHKITEITNNPDVYSIASKALDALDQKDSNE